MNEPKMKEADEGKEKPPGPDESFSIHPQRILADEDIRHKLVTPKSEIAVTKAEIIIYFTFSISFVIVVLLLFDPFTHYMMNSAIRAEFNGYTRPFLKVTSKTQFIAWAKEFFRYAYDTSFYPGRNRPAQKAPEVCYSDFFVSPIRFVQRRMRTREADFGDFENFNAKIWAGDGFDPNSGKSDDEDDRSYGPNNAYQYIKRKYLSGYFITINLFNDTYETATEKIQQYEDSDWIDAYTRTIFVDYVLYNPNTKIFVYVQQMITFSKTGSITTSLNTLNVNQHYYAGSGVQLFRALCEGLFFVILVFYSWRQPMEFYATYKRVADEIADQRYIEEHRPGPNKKKAGSIVSSVLDNVLGKIRFVILVFFTHFSNFWRIMDMCSIALAVTSLIYWVWFVIIYGSFTMTPAAFEVDSTNDMYFYITQILYTNRKLCAFNLIIIFIRVLKYLGGLTERVTVIFNTLAIAQSSIFYYVFLIMCVLLSFVMFVYMFFGAKVSGLSDMGQVITVLFQFMNWWYESFDEMMRVNFLMGGILFLVFMIVVVFVLLNMFVGFLLTGYRKANHDLKLRVSGCNEEGVKVDFTIPKHWVLHLRDVVVGTVGVLCPHLKKMKVRWDQEREQCQHKMNILKDPSTDYDKDFDPLQSLAQEKTMLPLTSLFVEEKYNLERDKRCGRIFYSTLVYIVFVIIYMCVITFQIRVDRGSVLLDSARSKIIDSAKYVLGDDDPKAYSFLDIADFQYMAAFVRRGLPQVPVVSNGTARYYYVIGSELKITMRLGIMRNPSSLLEKRYERLTSENMLWQDTLPGERTVTMVGNSTNRLYNYSRSGAFRGLSGYVMYWPTNETECKELAEGFVQDGIIGPDMWIFAVEYVTYEPTMASCVYVSMITSFYGTGPIYKEIASYPLRFKLYSTAEDYVRAVFEFVLVAFIGFYIFTLTNDMINKWREYDNWFELKHTTLSALDRYQRGQQAPEFIRKLKYLFSMFRILDILFLVFSIMALCYWVVLLAKTNGLTVNLPYDHNNMDYHEKMRSAAEIQRMFINYASLALIFIVLRLVEYVQYAGNMQVITKGLLSAQEDIVYFAIIFASFMMGFAAMAHIAFGENSRAFRSLGEAWASCFFIMMGEFNIRDILMIDSVITTVFLFVYLILFSYVLLNIFLAILETGYTDACKSLSKIHDSVRKLNVLQCCVLPQYPTITALTSEARHAGSLLTYYERLSEFNIHIDSRVTSRYWWADDLARQLVNDTERRRVMHTLATKAALAVPVADTRNVKAHEMVAAALTRAYKLHYLRIGSQVIQYQILGIENKMRHLDTSIEENTRQFIEGRKTHYIVQLGYTQLAHEVNSVIHNRSAARRVPLELYKRSPHSADPQQDQAYPPLAHVHQLQLGPKQRSRHRDDQAHLSTINPHNNRVAPKHDCSHDGQQPSERGFTHPHEPGDQ